MKSTTVQLLQSSDLTNKISPEVSDIQSGSLANSEGASVCRKSMFFQKKCLFSIPNPKPLPRGERLCMLDWLCIVQSPCTYTPGIRAGAILLGLPPLVPVGGYAPATPFSINKRFIDRLKQPFFTAV